jgi:hypothetical protein
MIKSVCKHQLLNERKGGALQREGDQFGIDFANKKMCRWDLFYGGFLPGWGRNWPHKARISFCLARGDDKKYPAVIFSLVLEAAPHVPMQKRPNHCLFPVHTTPHHHHTHLLLLLLYPVLVSGMLYIFSVGRLVFDFHESHLVPTCHRDRSGASSPVNIKPLPM